jgi:hypothetical protein
VAGEHGQLGAHLLASSDSYSYQQCTAKVISWVASLYLPTAQTLRAELAATLPTVLVPAQPRG